MTTTPTPEGTQAAVRRGWHLSPRFAVYVAPLCALVLYLCHRRQREFAILGVQWDHAFSFVTVHAAWRPDNAGLGICMAGKYDGEKYVPWFGLFDCGTLGLHICGIWLLRRITEAQHG